eukprot:CAMPEP_0197443974 /NCGR_PEP_ID=MMETSP1175-20131217/9581_1 /TAXON_ID=1003142 /ORGANISM="Triceratium dubium, Strain CCMP147" /LENGTH=422 /DNA_ID=CAMNT_0042974689 /DNA_START=288 /DNA_END=1553 /DNA_ORIENTATION=-
MTISPPKSVALAIAPKLTATLSMFGSAVILLKVVRSPKRRNQIMHRIMLGLSISDILSAIFFFASTWPIPEGTPSWFGDGTQPIFWAVGSERSCNVAGFFVQFQVANPLFNATLATYYLLTVYYAWDDKRLKKIEWLFYAIPFGYAIVTSTFAVAANLIGHVEWTCWILPPELFIEGAELTNMQRSFRKIQWIFLFGPVWCCIFYISVIFALLYRKMKALELKLMRYSVALSSRQHREGSRIRSYLSPFVSSIKRTVASPSYPQETEEGKSDQQQADNSALGNVNPDLQDEEFESGQQTTIDLERMESTATAISDSIHAMMDRIGIGVEEARLKRTSTNGSACGVGVGKEELKLEKDTCMLFLAEETKEEQSDQQQADSSGLDEDSFEDVEGSVSMNERIGPDERRDLPDAEESSTPLANVG